MVRLVGCISARGDDEDAAEGKQRSNNAVVARIVLLMLVVSACSVGSGVGPPAASTTASTGSTGDTTPTDGTSPTDATISISTVSTAPLRPAVCAAFSDPVAIGTITDPALVEVSGIAVGTNGAIWAHNDSGNQARLWALDPSGSVLGSLAVGAQNVDWEDMSVASSPNGRVFLYLADIGDNLSLRSSVTIHRFEEPSALDGDVEELESLVVRYPGGSVDAEAFFVDPSSGDSFIVTKTPTGRSSLLRIPVGAWSNPSVEAEHVAMIDLGVLSFVTAGAISSDGSTIALRTYRSVWLWERHGDEPVADAMGLAPCEAPSPTEPQGEALAFDGNDLLSVSEGTGAVIYRIER